MCFSYTIPTTAQKGKGHSCPILTAFFSSRPRGPAPVGAALYSEAGALTNQLYLHGLRYNSTLRRRYLHKNPRKITQNPSTDTRANGGSLESSKACPPRQKPPIIHGQPWFPICRTENGSPACKTSFAKSRSCHLLLVRRGPAWKCPSIQPGPVRPVKRKYNRRRGVCKTNERLPVTADAPGQAFAVAAGPRARFEADFSRGPLITNRLGDCDRGATGPNIYEWRAVGSKHPAGAYTKAAP